MTIDKFVRDEVRRRIHQAWQQSKQQSKQHSNRGPHGSRPDVNIARAVNVASPGRQTSVSSTQHVVIRDQRDRNR
jgi:hypothetical protein